MSAHGLCPSIAQAFRCEHECYILESKTIDNGCLYNSLDEYKAHNKPLWYELLYTDSHFQSAIQISMCLVVEEYGPTYKY